MEEWTVATYAARFLAATRTRRKPRTVECYTTALQTHLVPAFGAGTPLRAITRPMVRAFVEERLAAGYSPYTVRFLTKVLRAVLMEAVEDEILESCAAVRLARLFPARYVQPRDRAVPRAHVEAFLRAAQQHTPRLAPLLVVLARSGVRIGEALATTWHDVDFDAATLRVAHSLDWRGRLGSTKGGRPRMVDLGRDALSALEELALAREPGVPFVFVSSTGHPWSRSHLWRKMRRLCSLAGIPPFGVHVLRHSFATHLADAGVSPRVIQELLGHRSVAITEGYIATGGRHRDAVTQLDTGLV